MYLNTWMDWSTIDISQYARENSTYSAFYFHWRDELFSYVMRLFKAKTDPIPMKEIEIRLMMQGHCGIAELDFSGKKELTAFWGYPNGISKYRDDLPFYSCRCPVWAGNLTVGKDCEVIKNNTLMNPLFDLVHHYAILLAHNEVTMIHTLVNARNANGVPIASTTKQKKSIKEFIGKVFNGQYDVVTDIGNMGIEYAGANTGTALGASELWDSRERILNSFLESIGVKGSLEKNSNSVVDEVNAGTPRLLINLDDMLNERNEACDRINRHWGVNWSYELNENLDYVNDFVKGEAEDVQSDRSVQSTGNE